MTCVKAGGAMHWRQAVMIIVAMGALLVSSAGAGAVLAADPTTGAVIYFSRTSDAMAMAVRPDGTGLTAVGCHGDRTHQGAPRRALGLEATGTTFRIVSGTGWWNVPVMRMTSRADGCGDPVVLWDPGSGYQLDAAAWSIDGTRVAMAGRRFDDLGQMVEQGIWVAEVGGACGTPLCGLHLAVSFPLIAGAPRADGLVAYHAYPLGVSWSPDGRHVTYTRTVDPTAAAPVSGIFVADLGLPYQAGSGERRVVVTGEARSMWSPTFSPVAGSDQIAYTVTTSPKGTVRNDIFVVAAAGGTPRQVTSTRTASMLQMMHPTWSPDGQWIAFDGYTASVNGAAIYRMRADGKTKAVLVTSLADTNLYVPSWRP